MRLLLLLTLLSLTNITWAKSPFPMTVKERLRILLWTEGLKDPMLDKQYPVKLKELPEELARPLKQI